MEDVEDNFTNLIKKIQVLMSPTSPKRISEEEEEDTAKQPLDPPSTPVMLQSKKQQQSGTPSRSSSLLLVAGLLLSSSTPPISITSSRSYSKISSRGMSPVRTSRKLEFELSGSEQASATQNDDLDVSDEEIEEMEEWEKKNEDLSSDDLKSWIERLRSLSEEEEEEAETVQKLVREADSIFSDDTSMSSTSGVYLIEDRRGKVGVYKPSCLEHIKHKGKNPLRNGLKSGDGALREVAAYALDSSSGRNRAGVPPTVLYKSGSLQKFVLHDCDAEDVGTALFDVENVHRIGILDLRIFNLDRHGGNMLFDSQSNRLVPIDHGLSFPPLNCLSEAEFGWMHWRQAKESFSGRTLAYLKDLDLSRDVAVLREIGLPESSVATMLVSTSVLRHCALKLGMTLFEIASCFVRRKELEIPSILENVVNKTIKENDELKITSVNFAEKVVENIDLEIRRIRKERFIEAFKKGINTTEIWKKMGPAVTP